MRLEGKLRYAEDHLGYVPQGIRMRISYFPLSGKRKAEISSFIY
jgi:hypothetical protein